MDITEKKSEVTFEIMNWLERNSLVESSKIKECLLLGNYFYIDPFMINFSLLNRYQYNDSSFHFMTAYKGTAYGKRFYHVPKKSEFLVFLRLYEESRKMSVSFLEALCSEIFNPEIGLEVFADQLIEKGNPLGEEIMEVLHVRYEIFHKSL